ncbi:MAG: hypothetical protein V9F04_04530 [Dermatophilaceae bacterium]
MSEITDTKATMSSFDRAKTKWTMYPMTGHLPSDDNLREPQEPEYPERYVPVCLDCGDELKPGESTFCRYHVNDHGWQHRP